MTDEPKDGKIMELNESELTMLVSALDKKIWGFDHVGMGDGDPRKIAYKDLKTKVRAELDRKLSES